MGSICAALYFDEHEFTFMYQSEACHAPGCQVITLLALRVLVQKHASTLVLTASYSLAVFVISPLLSPLLLSLTSLLTH